MQEAKLGQLQHEQAHRVHPPPRAQGVLGQPPCRSTAIRNHCLIWNTKKKDIRSLTQIYRDQCLSDVFFRQSPRTKVLGGQFFFPVYFV